MVVKRNWMVVKRGQGARHCEIGEACVVGLLMVEGKEAAGSRAAGVRVADACGGFGP